MIRISELYQSTMVKHKMNGYENNEHFWDSLCHQSDETTEK